MSNDDFNAVLRTSGKTALALAALIIGGGSVSVIVSNDDGNDPRVAECKRDLDAIRSELASLRAERPVQRVEPRDSTQLEVSSMVGAGRE